MRSDIGVVRFVFLYIRKFKENITFYYCIIKEDHIMYVLYRPNPLNQSFVFLTNGSIIIYTHIMDMHT